eukprot:XP_012808738.1 PREDICTED: uncharacterized protein LOC101731310 isoform X3 [Xenopus tropicalis]
MPGLVCQEGIRKETEADFANLKKIHLRVMVMRRWPYTSTDTQSRRRDRRYLHYIAGDGLHISRVCISLNMSAVPDGSPLPCAQDSPGRIIPLQSPDVDNTSPSLFSDDEDGDLATAITDRRKEIFGRESSTPQRPAKVCGCSGAIQNTEWGAADDQRPAAGSSWFYPRADSEGSEEGAEISYTSEQPLLEISNSPTMSNTSENYGSTMECGQNTYSIEDFIPEEFTEKGAPACNTLEEQTSNIQRPKEKGEEMEESESSVRERHTNSMKHLDGSRFRYQYSPARSEMVQAIHRLSYSEGLIQWAMEYLSQQDERTGQHKRKRIQ